MNIEKTITYGMDNSGRLIPLPINQSGSETAIDTFANNRLFTGTDFEQQWANTPLLGPFSTNDDEILPSASRTASVNSSALVNRNHRGIHVITNITVIPSGSITVTLQALDNLSGEWYNLLVGPAYTTTGVKLLKLYPGIATIPNGAASDILPRNYRVSVAAADTTAITYSIGQNKVV